MSLKFSPQRLKLLPKSWKTPQICIKIPFGARNFGLQRSLAVGELLSA
jgi:hypothetical protein